MEQSKKPLETITKSEADRLVRYGIRIDKLPVCAGIFMALTSGPFAYIWDKFAVKGGYTVLNFKSLWPSAPDWNYDEIFTYFLVFGALLGTATAIKAIYSPINLRRQYKANPEEFIRENYGRKLV